MKIEELKEIKKILIIGYGIEGQAVHAFLKKHHPSAEIGIADKKDGKDYLQKQQYYDLAVKTPSVHPNLVTIPYTTATNIFFANARGTSIGVTGTKGKSTTSTLIYEMVKEDGSDAYLGGNIGISPLTFIDELTDNSVTVLELSSYQLQDIQYSPHIAVLLMVTSEHLDYHKNIENYVSAKRNILRFQTSKDFAVLNRDYPVTNESDIHTNARIFYVSIEREAGDGCYALANTIWLQRGGRKQQIMSTADVLLRGKHNQENACAAIMAATLGGASQNSIVHTLKTFKGLEHRIEFVANKHNIAYYDDSIATIPEATMQAINTLGENVETLIAGGYDRGLEFGELGKYLAGSKVKNLILFSPSGKRIWKAVEEARGNDHTRVFMIDSMQQAVKIAASETSAGKICLLSPASASYSNFKDFKDRGEQFKEEVKKL